MERLGRLRAVPAYGARPAAAVLVPGDALVREHGGRMRLGGVHEAAVAVLVLP